MKINYISHVNARKIQWHFCKLGWTWEQNVELEITSIHGSWPRACGFRASWPIQQNSIQLST